MVPASDADIDPAVMARAAALVRERARSLAPGAEIHLLPEPPADVAGPAEEADADAFDPVDAGSAGPVPLAGRRSRLAVDLATDTVLLDGEPVAFTTMEYKLLRYLVENCSRAISREELQRLIESLDCPGAAFRSIDVYVGRVRRKLGSARHAVATVRGGGYQFVPGPNASVRGPAEYAI